MVYDVHRVARPTNEGGSLRKTSTVMMQFFYIARSVLNSRCGEMCMQLSLQKLFCLLRQRGTKYIEFRK